MANNKITLSANGSKGNHKYTLTVEETATNATKNTSTVTINFSLTHIHSGYNWQDHSSVKGTVTVNGTSYSWALPNYDGSGEAKLITNKTQTITHNTDGSKSISVSFSCKADTSYSYLPGTASNSGSLKLATLARASSFSVANGTLGSSQSITVTKKNKSYGHTISAKVGSLPAQTVVAQSKSGSSGTNVTHTWTPPKSFASANTKGKTVSATLTLQTYSGTTGTDTIGSAVTKTITYTIPSDVKCEISEITFGDATKYSSSETLLSHFGGYIQGKSKVVATITTSTTNAQGATPTKAEITANGITYSSDEPSSGKFVITTNVVGKYGNDIEVTSKLTDSRGMTDVPETASTIKVFQYFDPKIANFSVGRCTKSGSTYTEDDSGNCCIIKIKSSFAPLTGATVANTAKAKLTYRIGENGAETIIAPPSGKTADSDGYFSVENDIDINNIYFDNAKQDTAYIITLSVKDTVGTITTVSRPLSTAVSIMDFPVTGEAMGIGKVVDQSRQSGGNLDIGWDMYVKDINILGELFYKPGDTFELFTATTSDGTGVGGTTLPGLVTSSTKQIRLGVNVGKSLKNIESVSVTRLRGGIRTPSGGYVNGKGDSTEWLSEAGITVDAFITGDKTVLVRMTSTSAYTSVSNNMPLAMGCNDLVLEFS